MPAHPPASKPSSAARIDVPHQACEWPAPTLAGLAAALLLSGCSVVGATVAVGSAAVSAASTVGSAAVSVASTTVGLTYDVAKAGVNAATGTGDPAPAK